MLEVKLLGQFNVLLDGKRLIIPTRNAQSLFAYLVLNAGRAHRREQLAGLLWPDSNEKNARSNLRHELWRLRKSLDIKVEKVFLIDDLTIAFNAQSDYSVDVYGLEKVPVEGSTAEDLIGALSCYQGELLPGFYDEWIFAERERLAALFETRMTRLLEILQTEGRWGDVQEWGMRWIGLGHLPEPAYRALMAAYANTGDLAKAAATYERLTRGLQKELGVMPSEQTQALYERIEAGWKSNPQAKAQSSAAQLLRSPAVFITPAFSLPRLRRSNLPRP